MKRKLSEFYYNNEHNDDNLHIFFTNQTTNNLNDLIENHLKHIKIKD